MTLKPPTGLAAETESTQDLEDLSEELRVDASDDVTVEAAEEVTVESVTAGQEALGATAPPPASFASSAEGGSDPGPTPLPASLMDVLGTSLPLPGVTAAASPHFAPDLAEPTSEDDVATLARGGDDDLTRPAVTDDEEEETKVEAATTALHAAATRDEVGTALSEQASYEREKALRKSSPGLFSSEARAANSGVEFADPDGDEDDDEVISAGPIVEEDDDGIVVGGGDANRQHPVEDDVDDDSTAMFGRSSDPSPLVAALTARRPGSPPSGSPFRADGFGSARLPAPSPGFAPLALSSTASLPAPASSPFGKLASVPSPYGSARTTSMSLPALQIPAPSGAAATPTDGMGLFRKVPIPLGGLLAVGLSCVGAGVIIGWLARGTPAPAAHEAALSAPPKVTAPPIPPPPVVQPVPAPEPVAAAAAPIAPAALPAASGSPSAAEPAAVKTSPPAGDEAPAEPLPAARPQVKRVAKPRKPPSDLADDLSPPAPKPAPKAAAPSAPKPAKASAKGGGKSGKAWVDPFAD